MSNQIRVRNPRTGATDYEISPPNDAELGSIERRVRQSQHEWRESGIDHRIDALRAWKTEIDANREELLDALTADTGRRGVSELEMKTVVDTIDRVCEQAPSVLDTDGESRSSVPFVRIDAQLVPYQLVGVVSPWNFPLLLSGIDAVPALAAGCAVIAKPSEITPRFIEPLRDTIEAVPELGDVLEFVPGAGGTGTALVDRADAVAFTGSVETGRKIAAQAAGTLKPTFLELGGKDPAVVLESADLEGATSAILWGATANSGQSCQSIERVYVHESRYEAFVDRITQKAERLDLAHPEFDSGELGPIISRDQVDTIRTHLDDAVSKGATVRCGGEIATLGGGRWLRPTVLTDVDHSMKVATEETFGPLVPIMPFQDVDEAVELANDTVYGLSGAVFAGTEAEALAVGRRLDAGAISINDASLTAILQEGEKQAFKRSGLGESRTGPKAIGRFLQPKALMVKTNTVPDPWWYETNDSSSGG